MAKKKAGSTKLLKQLEEAIERLDLKRVQVLLEDPAALKLIDDEGLLAYVVTCYRDNDNIKRELKLIRRLVERGASTTTSHPIHGSILCLAVSADWETEEQGTELVQDLLRAGADPNVTDDRFSALGWAVERSRHDLIEMFFGQTTEATRLDALNVAIARVTSWVDPARGYPMLDFMLERVKDIDVCGRFHLSPVHQAALYADAETLRRVLGRARKPALGLDAETKLYVGEATPPGGGLIPSLELPAGLNALELAERVQEFVEAKRRAYEKGDDSRREIRSRYLARLAENIEVLRAVTCCAPFTSGGAQALGSALQGGSPAPRAVGLEAHTNGELPRPSPPPFKVALDAELHRLAERAGGDRPALQQELDTIELADLGPWGYFTAALQTSRQRLVSDAMDTSRSQLHRFLTGDPFCGGPVPDVDADPDDAFDGDSYPLDLSHYPKESRKALRQGVIVGASDADLIVLWPQKDGTARVCHAHPEGFWILGQTVIDFIRDEVGRILG